MNVGEVRGYLTAAHVNPHIYDIGPPRLAEAFVIELTASGWITYVWERGKKSFVKQYADESSAVEDFVFEVMEIAKKSKGGFIG